MKNLCRIFLFVLLFFSFSFSVFALDLDIKSEKAILINLNDDSVLYSKNENDKTYIASLTKVVTALVVVENVDLNEKVMITDEDWEGLIENDASVANYSLNKEYTYLDLLYGLLLPSGADCANSLARNVGGDVFSFVEMMNEKVKSLGLKNTSFANPTGLDDDNNYSTALDVSIFMRYALKNEVLKKIMSTKQYTTYDGITVYNTLFTFSNYYGVEIPYVVGGKTGTTEKAYGCLASFLEYDGVSYLLITLNAIRPGQFEDCRDIYNYFIENYGYKTLLNKGDVITDIDVLYAKYDNVSIKALKDYSYYLSNDIDTSLIKLDYVGDKEVSYRNKKGDLLGHLNIYYGDVLLDKVDVKLDRNIKFNFFSFFKDNIILFGIEFVFLIILFICIFHKKRII